VSAFNVTCTLHLAETECFQFFSKMAHCTNHKMQISSKGILICYNSQYGVHLMKFHQKNGILLLCSVFTVISRKWTSRPI